MAKKKKFYVVWQGLTPGVYDSWGAVQAQINGFPGAKYKSFGTEKEAREAFYSPYSTHVSLKKSKNPLKKELEDFSGDVVWNSISVDAACSGNPGILEYQGVDTKTKSQFFYQKFTFGTNNIGEFLALVHGLAWLKQRGLNTAIYSDSRIAIGWVYKGKAKTTLKRDRRTEQLFDLIDRAETWLKKNKGMWENPILKWETEKWGEIPADFGRK